MMRGETVFRLFGRFHFGHGTPFLAVLIRESSKDLGSITIGDARFLVHLRQRWGVINSYLPCTRR